MGMMTWVPSASSRSRFLIFEYKMQGTVGTAGVWSGQDAPVFCLFPSTLTGSEISAKTISVSHAFLIPQASKSFHLYGLNLH